MTGRFWIVCGALSAAVAVIAGAMGTHYLKETLELPAKELETYEVAVRYQMYHAFGLILVGVLVGRAPSRWLSAAAVLLLTGTVLFSGGIYAWLASGFKPFVHVVPLGGTVWIVAWLLIAVGEFRQGR